MGLFPDLDAVARGVQAGQSQLLELLGDILTELRVANMLQQAALDRDRNYVDMHKFYEKARAGDVPD